MKGVKDQISSFSTKRPMHAGGQAEDDIERQREKLVVQNGGDGQDSAAEHGPAGADEQAEENDGLKGDVGGEKVGHHEPDPNARA